MATGNYILTNDSSCCFLSRFKVVSVTTWKASCDKLQDCLKGYTNHQLVVKLGQILCVTSCKFDAQAAKPKFVSQSRPALYIFCNNKLITQGDRLFVSKILLPSLKRWYTRYVFFLYFTAFRTAQHILFYSAL